MENERTSSPASFADVRGKSPLILSMCARPSLLAPLYFCASLLRSEGSREVIRGAALIFSKWEWFARSSFSAPSLTANGARTDAAAALCSMWMETTDWRLERQRERAKKGGSGE